MLCNMLSNLYDYPFKSPFESTKKQSRFFNTFLIVFRKKIIVWLTVIKNIYIIFLVLNQIFKFVIEKTIRY